MPLGNMNQHMHFCAGSAQLTRPSVLRRRLAAASAPIRTYSNLLVERFATVLAVDLSLAMLQLAPIGPHREIDRRGAGQVRVTGACFGEREPRPPFVVLSAAAP
jgi:hypothetical protein